MSSGPFFAAALGFMILGERLSLLEIGGLFVCSLSVLLIAIGGGVRGDSAGNNGTLEDNSDDSSHMIGIAFMLVNAFVYACVTISARQLQKVSFLTILFYEGLVATPTTMCLLLYQSNSGHQEISMLTYSTKQYCWVLLPVFINFFSVSASTIASQNERSGFITLLA